MTKRIDLTYMLSTMHLLAVVFVVFAVFAVSALFNVRLHPFHPLLMLVFVAFVVFVVSAASVLVRLALVRLVFARLVSAYLALAIAEFVNVVLGSHLYHCAIHLPTYGDLRAASITPLDPNRVRPNKISDPARCS